MSGKYIHLSFGVARDQTMDQTKSFTKLLKGCFIWSASLSLSSRESSNKSLQKYLLAIGLLKDSIQDSLDMIVTDGKFNNVSFRRTLDTT